MKYNQITLNKFINKALSIVGADKNYEEILAGEAETLKGKKKPKDYLPYYLRFPYKSVEQRNTFYKYLEVEVKKLNPSLDEDKLKIQVDFIDMLVSPSEILLLSKEIDIKNEVLKTEKI